MPRISLEKIALMKQYWRDGYDIPSIAKMCGSTPTTVKKKLGSDIQTYINEHELAKTRRLDNEAEQAKAAIIPEPVKFNMVMTNETIKDDKELELAAIADNERIIEQQMSADKAIAEELDMPDEQFISLLEYEFSQANTYEEAKELYWEYKPQSIINIKRVEAFRAIYEQTLSRVSSKPKAEPAADVIIDDGTVESLSENNLQKPKGKPKTVENTKEYGDFRLAWATEVNELNARFDCGIKTINKKRHINWTQTRYLAHIYYWLRLKSSDKSQWIGISRFNKLSSDEERRALVNELVANLEAES